MKHTPGTTVPGVILHKNTRLFLGNVHRYKPCVRGARKKFPDIVCFAKIVIEIFPGFVYNDCSVARATVTVIVGGGGLPERRTHNHVHCKFYS